MCVSLSAVIISTDDFKRSRAPYVLSCASRACRAIDSPGTSYSPLPHVYALTHVCTHGRTHARTRLYTQVHANTTMTTMQRCRASSFVRTALLLAIPALRSPPRILIELSPLLMRLRSVSVESLASELRASASVCARACTGHAAASGTLLIYSRTR